MYEKPHECNWKARLELAVEGFEQQTTTWGESLKLILSGGIHLLISLIDQGLKVLGSFRRNTNFSGFVIENSYKEPSQNII